MAEQNDCIHTPDTCRKRTSNQSLHSPTKKRVALGDITNSPCANVPTQNSDLELQKPKLGITRIGGSSLLIYQHLHAMEMEDKRRPHPDYMEKVQDDISPKMREILVAWLVEVAEEYNLVSDTLFRSISYIDLFLSSKALSRNKLQLLGVSYMLIASKSEDISPAHVDELCYMTDNSYTKEEVVNMERDVLKTLNSGKGGPTTKCFLRNFMRTSKTRSQSHSTQLEPLSCYLAKLSLLDYRCLRFLPSVIAASSIFLSKFTLEPTIHPWSSTLQNFLGYKPSDLKKCVLRIHSLQLNRRGSTPSGAIRQKYQQSLFRNVAALVSRPEISKHYFEAIKE